MHRTYVSELHRKCVVAALLRLEYGTIHDTAIGYRSGLIGSVYPIVRNIPAQSSFAKPRRTVSLYMANRHRMPLLVVRTAVRRTAVFRRFDRKPVFTAKILF